MAEKLFCRKENERLEWGQQFRRTDAEGDTVRGKDAPKLVVTRAMAETKGPRGNGRRLQGQRVTSSLGGRCSGGPSSMQTPPSHPLWRQARWWDPSAEGQQASAFRSEHRQEAAHLGARVVQAHVLLLKPTLGP